MSLPNYTYLAGGFPILSFNILLNIIRDLDKTLDECRIIENHGNRIISIKTHGQSLKEWIGKFVNFNIQKGDLDVPDLSCSINESYIVNIMGKFKGKRIVKNDLIEYSEEFGQFFIDKNEEIFECRLINWSILSISWIYTAIKKLDTFEEVFNPLKKVLDARYHRIKRVKLGEQLLAFQKEKCFEQSVYNNLLMGLESLSIFIPPYTKLIHFQNNAATSNELTEREFKDALVVQDLVSRVVNQWVIGTPKEVRRNLSENLLRKVLIRYVRSLNDISFRNLTRDLPEYLREQKDWIIVIKKIIVDQIMDKGLDIKGEIEKAENIKSLFGKTPIYTISREEYNKIYTTGNNRLILSRMVVTCAIMYVNEVPKAWGIDLVIKFSKKSVIKMIKNFSMGTKKNILVAYRITEESLITIFNLQCLLIYIILDMANRLWEEKVKYAWLRRKNLDKNTRPSPSDSLSSNSSQPATTPSAHMSANQGSRYTQTEEAPQSATNQGSRSAQTEGNSQAAINQSSQSAQTEGNSQAAINQSSQSAQTEGNSQATTNENSRYTQVGESSHSATDNISQNSNSQNLQNTSVRNNRANPSDAPLIGIPPYIANKMSDEFKSWYRQQPEDNMEFVRAVIDCVKNPVGVDNFVMANQEFFKGSRHAQYFVEWAKSEGRLSKSGAVDGLVERLKGEGFSKDFKINFASKLRV